MEAAQAFGFVCGGCGVIAGEVWPTPAGGSVCTMCRAAGKNPPPARPDDTARTCACPMCEFHVTAYAMRDAARSRPAQP